MEQSKKAPGPGSNDISAMPAEEQQLESKKENVAKDQPGKGPQNSGNDVTAKDIPDATNTSTGAMGSGQRQDTN